MTVRLNLSAPFSPLLAQLADRAGMMVSPKAATAAGDKFGANPVCSGPFKFVERVAQDRIVLERYPNYWNKGEIFLDASSTCRSSTRRCASPTSSRASSTSSSAWRRPTCRALKSDSRFKIAKITEIGYQGITINVGKSEQAKNNRDRQGPARARGVRAGARPRRHRAGRDGRRGDRRQPVGGAEQPVLREERADPEARRREGEGAARAGRACRIRSSS